LDLEIVTAALKLSSGGFFGDNFALAFGGGFGAFRHYRSTWLAFFRLRRVGRRALVSGAGRAPLRIR